MKYEIEWINPERLFIVKTYGDMTGRDFIAMAEDILGKTDYKPNDNVLFDHRELNFENVTLREIEGIRDFHRENESKIGNGKSAIVVKSLSGWNNIWDRGEKIKTGNVVKVFDDFDNALNWIRVKN
ncbi:MAG: STAS/SEC14 domain-containing protein [Elusimicrobia bacterium]|nr:STAS/SEC14 domain-containing protein [Elusimicrobiota bacterium]